MKNEPCQQSSKSNSQPGIEINSDDIAEIYRRMTRLYGHKFVSNFGTSDDGTWLMALTGLKRNDLSRGLTALMKRADDWPPSVPMFKRMCLGITNKHIEEKALELARGRNGYDFDRLSEKEAYHRCRHKLDQATEEIMDEFLELASNDKLESTLEKFNQHIIEESNKPKRSRYLGKGNVI